MLRAHLALATKVPLQQEEKKIHVSYFCVEKVTDTAASGDVIHGMCFGCSARRARRIIGSILAHFLANQIG